jgi:hypothetical protein
VAVDSAAAVVLAAVADSAADAWVGAAVLEEAPHMVAASAAAVVAPMVAADIANRNWKCKSPSASARGLFL